MANGIPVVQPSHGAFPEILQKTGGGLLVPPGDVRALADALHRVWREPALASELGRRGADGVRTHFASSVVADKALAVYAAVIGRAAGPSERRAASA
jgi:glycosyltransferase involved in cell wall biosynthesis